MRLVIACNCLQIRDLAGDVAGDENATQPTEYSNESLIWRVEIPFLIVDQNITSPSPIAPMGYAGEGEVYLLNDREYPFSTRQTPPRGGIWQQPQ